MSEVGALLDRLVGQFEGPYDFLRELVQNALDAGSDRAEVTLDVHPGEGADPDEVVFELRLADTGSGMDEAVIDGGLTRLFASTKADDRTMAGGFGIGFVSVFAWQPDAVVVQTGRAGEAWELTFYGDRHFDKRALDEPFEGTTVTLLRRGRAPERAQIAEAIRDSLWRWCRFCQLELSFEDLAAGEGPELIQDAPEPPGALAVVEAGADSSVQVAFAVPPEAVMLRRGLVLSQGTAATVLADLQPPQGSTLEHLQVWADSPNLRTTMARDKVIDDPGRVAVLAKIGQAIAELRRRLVAGIAAAAAEPGPWTRARHEHYAYLQAHLAHEREHLKAAIIEAPLLHIYNNINKNDEGGAISLAQLRSLGRPVLWAPPEAEDAKLRELLAAANLLNLNPNNSVPVLAAEAGDREWLGGLLELIDINFLRNCFEFGRCCELMREEDAGEAEGLRAAVEAGLQRAGANVRLLVGAPIGEAAGRPGLGLELGRGAAGALVLWTGAALAGSAWKNGTLWLDAREPLLRAALKSFEVEPRAATRGLALALRAQLGDGPTPEKLAEAIDAGLAAAEGV